MQLHESSFMASLETTSPWINDFWTHVLRSHWKSSAHLFPMRKCTNIHQQSCLLIPTKATRPDRAKLVAKRPRQGLGVGRHKPSVLGDSTDRAHGGLLRQVAREVLQGVPRASLNPLPCHLLFWSSCPADLAILCSQPMPWPQSPGSDGGSAACQATVPCALTTLQAGSFHKICVFSFAISSPRILQGHGVPCLSKVDRDAKDGTWKGLFSQSSSDPCPRGDVSWWNREIKASPFSYVFMYFWKMV